MSMPPARRRSKASTATRWSPACARTATATSLPLPAPAALAPLSRDLAQPGDFVVCLGAGSITNWANALPAELEALRRRARRQRA